MAISKRIIVLAVMLLAGSAIAQTTQPTGGVDSDQIRAAAKQFVLALGEEDPAFVKAQFAGTDDNYMLVEAMHDLLLAARHFESAGREKWPQSFKNGQNETIDASAMLDRVEHQKIQFEADGAVSFEGGLTLKQINGDWKVIDFSGQIKNKLPVVKMLTRRSKAMEEAAVEIGRGVYPTFTAAKAGLAAKLQVGPPTTMESPATQPAR